MSGFGVKKPVALTAGILPNLETAACGLSASQGSCGESSSRCFASVAGRKRPRAIRALKTAFDFGDIRSLVISRAMAVRPRCEISSARPKSFQRISNTSPLLLNLSVSYYRFDYFQTLILQCFKAVLSRFETYCANFSFGQGVQKRFQGGAS